MASPTLVAAEDAATVDLAAARRLMGIQEALAVSGVPPRYQEARFEDLEERKGASKAIAAARKAADGHGLVLIGPFGTGKTTLGACIVRERAERWAELDRHARDPFATRFIAVPHLLDAIRRSYEYQDEPDPLKPLLNARLLVLDDLGREKPTEWVLDRLYVLIDHRYTHLLPTVATTNFSLDELAQAGYGAMVSRLIEGADVVQMTAADRRRER